VAPPIDRGAQLKHHYVPQFALRYWAESDGKVPYYVRRNGRVVSDRLTPEYTAFEPNLYAFTNVPEQNRHALEREFFAKLESDAAPIYEKIERRDADLSQRERQVWSIVLMAANARVSEKVALAKQITDKHVRRALAERPEEYLAVKGEAVEATLLEWVENNVSGIENLGLIQMVKFLVNADRIREFLELEWIVHGLSHANVELLLPDRPLWISKRPADPDFIAMMPLSPRSVFIAARDKRVIRRTIDARPNELVRRINESAISNAWERVYGRATVDFVDRCLRQSQRIDEAVKNAMGDDGEPEG
jgi:hypothetical protein